MASSKQPPVAEMLAPAVPKASSKKEPKVKKPWYEKYDQTRTVLADPRDPRTLGPPCNGNHVEAGFYKGSVTGANGHACWKGCERCKLRLSYTPAFGATGSSRSPGPIPQDTNAVVSELKDQAPYNPKLKDPVIGLDGAEKSLMNQLDRIREKKEAHLVPGRQLPVTPSKASTPAAPTEVIKCDPEELPSHPSRKSRRPAEQQVELVDVEQTTSPPWSVVSSPQQES